MKRLAFFNALFFVLLATAQLQFSGEPLIVPGDQLGWEEDELRLVLQVKQDARIELQLYSPGFDPGDYRAANEMGDERYDRGQGELHALFELRSMDGELLARKRYGLEPHRWDTLFAGDLVAGDYLVYARFSGNGKNAVAFRLNAPPERAQLVLQPDAMQTYNVNHKHGYDWQEPFTVNVPDYGAPLKVGIYDGDGPQELQVRHLTPSGKVIALPTPGNREWVYVTLREPGEHRFGFRQTEGAYQVTNTVGIKVFYGPVEVRITDENDRPVPKADYSMIGLYERTVCLKVPPGWERVATHHRYGKPLGDNCVRFGVGGGSVHFVLRPQRSRVELNTRVLRCGEALPGDFPLRVAVGERAVEVQGRATVELAPGTYPLSVTAPAGTTVSAPRTVTLEPGKTTPVEVRVEPRYELTLATDRSELQVGEEVRITAELASPFGYAPALDLDLQLPQGLTVLRQEVDENRRRQGEAAGWSTVTTIYARADRAGSYQVAARAKPCGPAAQAPLVVHPAPAGKRPVPQLERALDKHVVLPGEEVGVVLRVRNAGDADLNYDLRDRLPACLTPLDAATFRGTLAPGETQQHRYRALARFHEEQEGRFQARLTSNGGDLDAPDTIRCVLLPIEKTVEKEKLTVGESSVFVVKVRNPTDHPVAVEVKDAPEPGLGLEPASRRFPLDPGEAAEWRLPFTPERAGALRNQATPFVGEVPVAQPVWAGVQVREPEALAGVRSSQVALPFSVDHELDAPCTGLLIGHAPPQGSAYVPGSSALDGRPLEDPRVDAEGRLLWKVPAASQGTLTYRLRHREALPRLAEPELTVLYGEVERPIAGSLSMKAYEAARPLAAESPGLLVAPRAGQVLAASDRVTLKVRSRDGQPPSVYVNGAALPEEHLGEVLENTETGERVYVYHNVALRTGENTLRIVSGGQSETASVFVAGAPARIEVVPVRAVADGRTPVELEVRVLDEAGLAVGDGYVVVQSPLEPLAADAAPTLSGYRVALRNGAARLRLQPTSKPGPLALKLGLGELTDTRVVEVEPAGRKVWLAHGSITAHYDLAGHFTLGGTARGYLETPFAGGHLQAAADAEAAMPVFDPARLRSANGLTEPEDPERRFPHTGSAGEAVLPLVSDDPVAFRYRNAPLTVGYERTEPGLPGLGDLPQLTALHLETDGRVEVSAFAGLTARTSALEEIVPDGTRVYWLSQPVKQGSETITLVVGGVETRLQRLRDYVVDYPSGVVFLSRPLWPVTDELVPVRLRVAYAPSTAPRDQLAGGAGVRAHFGPLSLGVAAATLDRGANWRFGAEAAYQARGFHARLGFDRGPAGDRFGLQALGRMGILETQINLSYAAAQLQGKARVSAHLSPRDRVVLEHRARSGDRRSEAAYERSLTRAFSVGAGLGYAWETNAVEAIGRARYSNGRLGLELTHAHPLGAARPETRLLGSYAFDDNLKARADLDYTWGLGLSGSLGLEQRVGLANLALSYALPGESGEGNRARFGIRAPLPLSERWFLDLMAGYDYAFATASGDAAAGVGVRYQGEGLKATLGVEGASGASGTKVTVRSGAAGQLGKAHTLGFDANYQLLPSTRGRFTVSYAFRGRRLTLLTYHRLSNLTEDVLEGELAPTWHPNPTFQLRPSAAYRVKFSDPAADTYQLGLAGNVYFTRYLGLGAGAYYMWQPASSADHLAFNVEASLRALDGVWLNLGYTFGGFAGLTPEARPGIYLRLDLMGGAQ